MKPSKRFFLISLAALAGVLVVYSLLRMAYGVFLPESIDKALPDVIMFAAVGIMLWNRKLRSDEEKLTAATKADAEAAANETAAQDLGEATVPADEEK